MNKRTTKKTTNPLVEKDRKVSTVRNRPTLTGGRVIVSEDMNYNDNTARKTKERIDKQGNVISVQTTNYNRIPFKNKAIDLINKFDRKVEMGLQDAIIQGPHRVKTDLSNAAYRVGKMLNKKNYGTYSVDSEFDGQNVRGTATQRPTMSGGTVSTERYDMPGGGRTIKKTKYNEEGLPVKRVVRDRGINK